MVKKLFRASNLGVATILISLTSLLSYVIGLFRDRIIAVSFGTTTATDTYNAAFLIPDLLFNTFIAGALAAAFLPVFSSQLQKNKKEAYQVANTMLTAGSLLIGLLAIIAFVFIDPIISSIFSDFAPSIQNDIKGMTKLILPSALFFAISNTIGNILMTYKHFVSYALSPVLYNLGIIFGVILFQDQLGIYAAATGVFVGAIFHMLIRIIDLFSTEYRWRPSLKVNTDSFKKIVRLMIPRSISLIAWQINLFLFAKVGISLIEGGLSAFHFSRNIQSFAVSLFGIAFATAAFPYLTDAANQKNHVSFTKQLQTTTQRILFFTIPAAFGVAALSEEIVSLILAGGVFDSNSVRITAQILTFFAISIPFESLVHILSRGFYAKHNTITPMILNLIAMAAMAFTTLVIAPQYGIKWFSIGFSISFAIQVLLLAIFLTKHLKEFQLSSFLKSIFKILVASSLMYLLVTNLQINIQDQANTIIKIALGGSAFLIITAILKSPEISSLKIVLRKFLPKS